MKSFRTWLEYVDGSGPALMPSVATGSEAPDTMALSGHPPHLSSTDLVIPNSVKTGQIVILRKNTNPIYVQLSDGTKLFLTYDEFKRIKGSPEVGRTMIVTFQRFPNDTSSQASQVQSITVS